MKTCSNRQSVFLFFKWVSQLSCCMDWDPPASSAVVVIATLCSCFIENKLAGFYRCWGYFYCWYDFLEPNRHFALKMSYALQCVYGPHRCEMRRWLLLDTIQSRRLPQSLRIISGCTVVLYCTAQVLTAWTNRPIHNCWTASPVTNCLCCPWHTGDRVVADASRRPSIAVSSQWKLGHYRNVENH